MLQSLMSVYYDPTRINKERPGFVSFEPGQFKKSPALGNFSCDRRQSSPKRHSNTEANARDFEIVCANLIHPQK